MLPAARVGDLEVCPVHGAGAVVGPGTPTVLIGNQIAVRQGDACICPGGQDPILDGSPTVLIGNQPAARQTERCAHGGVVTSGFPSVLIGNPAVGPDGTAIRTPTECAWLRSFGSVAPGSATGGKLDRLRDKITVKSIEVVTTKAPADGAPAQYTKTVVTIRGHDVAIYQPTTGPTPPQWIPTTSHMAKGLATLSDEQLAGIKEVYAVPHDYPARPDDVANHKDGVVQFFPRAVPHPQSDIDWVMQHESAHNIWDQQVKADPGFRSEWQRAMDRDHRIVSDYALKGIGEDFADFMVLYANVLGSPCEATARTLFPNRMKMMDRIFPRGLPVRNPSGASAPY